MSYFELPLTFWHLFLSKGMFPHLTSRLNFINWKLPAFPFGRRRLSQVSAVSIWIVKAARAGTCWSCDLGQVTSGSLRLFKCENWQMITPAWGFSGSSVVQNLPANAGDMGSILGLWRSPGEGKGNQFQYSCLENHTDRGAWQATVHGIAKSWTRLNN